jgi:hypothetical protein
MAHSAEAVATAAPAPTHDRLVAAGVDPMLAVQAAAMERDEVVEHVAALHWADIGGAEAQLGFARGLHVLANAEAAPVADPNRLGSGWDRTMRVALLVHLAGALGLEVKAPAEEA